MRLAGPLLPAAATVSSLVLKIAPKRSMMTIRAPSAIAV